MLDRRGSRLSFEQAVALREAIASGGWREDLLAVEAWGADIARGGTPKGYRVVLAWAWPSNRLERVYALEEVLQYSATEPTKGPRT